MQTISDEMAVELAALKSQVFPNGRMDDITIDEDFSHLSIVAVTISNLKQLRLLLSNTKVEAVHDIVKVKPALIESLPLVNQPAAIVGGKQGAGTRIAVLDASLDVKSPSFSTTGTYPACRGPDAPAGSGGDPIGTGRCRIADAINFADSTVGCWGYTSCHFADHGTVVAGIAANVAPATRISALQVYTATGSSDTDIINRAINWVISNVGSSGNKIVAMNLSLDISPGTVFSLPCPASRLGASIRKARELNIVPVVASGNAVSAAGISDPACVPGVVSVGAVHDYSADYSDGACGYTVKKDQVACYSNGGSLLTMLAPGDIITVNYLIGSEGTSLAAPFVAGAIAILRGTNAFPNDNASTTVSRLVNNGKPITDPRNGITRPRLDIFAALASTNPPSGDDSSADYGFPISAPIFNQLLLLDY